MDFKLFMLMIVKLNILISYEKKKKNENVPKKNYGNGLQ
jgi:hypothetical protein